MNSRSYIVIMLGLLLCARPALAESAKSLVWDLNVAPAAGDSVADPCRANPYALYRHSCSDEELNISLEASNQPRLSTLDRIALFLDRHKDLNLDTNLHSSTKLKFTVGLANLYSQEAHAQVTLRIRF
jgi:hypothetical protein